jgi:hypothetical protein
MSKCLLNYIKMILFHDSHHYKTYYYVQIFLLLLICLSFRNLQLYAYINISMSWCTSSALYHFYKELQTLDINYLLYALFLYCSYTRMFFLFVCLFVLFYYVILASHCPTSLCTLLFTRLVTETERPIWGNTRQSWSYTRTWRSARRKLLNVNPSIYTPDAVV